jgi:small subunit ribosomal protein S6
MVANERMGRRRLAYTIKKCDDGVYTRFLYDSDIAVPKELERRIRISDRVLRYLTVRLEPDWAVESKEQAVRDAQARADAEAARAAMPPGTEMPAPDDDETDEDAMDGEDDDRRDRWGAPRKRDGEDVRW